MAHKSKFSAWLFVIMGLLISGYGAQAQTETPENNSPQFLYRNGQNLILVNAETDDAQTLPGIVAGEKDHFEWSPDGQFVVIQTVANHELNPYCLNIYSMVERKMIYDKPLACEIEDAAISHNSAQIAYSTRSNDDTNAALWLHSLSSGTTARIYDTTGVYPTEPNGVVDIRWSPNDHYVSFISQERINSGWNNDLHILNPQSLHEYLLNTGGDDFDARYDPVWAPDEAWFLLDLKEQYVTNGADPRTNQMGDLYLVRSDTGQMHRLTFTPAEAETSPHWTEDGQIAYSISQTITLTVDDALNLQTPSPDSIVEPEPVDESPQSRCYVSEESPNSDTWAELCPSYDTVGNLTGFQEFNIIFDGGQTYKVKLAEGDYNSILIGWRTQG